MGEILEFPKKENSFKFKTICCYLYCQNEATVHQQCIVEGDNEVIHKHFCNAHIPLEFVGFDNA